MGIEADEGLERSGMGDEADKGVGRNGMGSNMKWLVFVEGLDDLKNIPELDDKVRRLRAAQAINETARHGRSKIADDIHDQVNFPAGYLKPSTGRLTVAQQATKAKLEARIRARGAPTSLARFSVGNTKPSSRGGVHVMVHPGKARFMRRAFVMKLRSGSADIETKFNLGLAIRLRPGETLQNKRYFRRVESNLYLLYGPSVNQVFRANDGDGVASDRAPYLSDHLADEFSRLLGL